MGDDGLGAGRSAGLDTIERLRGHGGCDHRRHDGHRARGRTALCGRGGEGDGHRFESEDPRGRAQRNVKGPWLALKHFGPQLRRGGSIVFNTSVNNLLAMPGSSVYAASKAALRSLVRVAASELAESGVRVNAVSPGPTETPRHTKLGFPAEVSKGFADGLIARISLRRFGTSAEIAKAALFLASDDSSFMTGDQIVVDGGMTRVRRGAPAARRAPALTVGLPSIWRAATVRTMRSLLASLTATVALATASGARAQSASASAPATAIAVEVEVERLELLHTESIATRRALADSVLVGGLVSIAGGGALVIPDADDLAWRFAGINTAIFGAVNTVVGLLALRGIAHEERIWESEEGRAARRTPEGLVRARIHAVIDERRESVGHAVNLGLNCAYAGVGGTAILASRLGVDHPNRWLASGLAVGFQAIFLIGIDFVGLARSLHYHRALVEGFTPAISVVPTPTGSETRIGFSGAF